MDDKYVAFSKLSAGAFPDFKAVAAQVSLDDARAARNLAADHLSELPCHALQIAAYSKSGEAPATWKQ